MKNQKKELSPDLVIILKQFIDLFSTQDLEQGDWIKCNKEVIDNLGSTKYVLKKDGSELLLLTLSENAFLYNPKNIEKACKMITSGDIASFNVLKLNNALQFI